VNAALQGYLDWLRGHGLSFAVADGLWQGADHDGPLIEDDAETRPIELPGLPPFVEHRDPAAGIAADHATMLVAEALLRGGVVTPGCRFWDVGCGTAVLAVAAGLAGARTIVATELDARAITVARRTAAEAGINVQFFKGSLLEPIPAKGIAEVVVANLPHKPVPYGSRLPLGQDGGPDGDEVHGSFVAQAEERLAAGARIVFFLHSLPHPRLLARYTNTFDLTLLAWKRRFLAVSGYGFLQDHFLARRESNDSFVVDEGDRHFLLAGAWLAVRR